MRSHRNMVTAAVVGLSMLTFAGAAKAAEYTRAIVYYYDWDVQVRGALSVDDVRERFHVKTDVRDLHDVENLVSALPTSWMDVPAGIQSVDVRLVIDLYQAEDRIVTYYASQFHLYAENGSKRAAIDESFKERFRSLTGAP